VLSFRLNFALNGLAPWGYHALNVLLHALATALLHRAALAFGGGDRHLACIASCLFAAHPANAEAVASVVGRAELLSLVLVLLALAAYRSGHGVRCVALAYSAHLCKETGLLALPLCVISDVALGDASAQPRPARWGVLAGTQGSLLLIP